MISPDDEAAWRRLGDLLAAERGGRSRATVSKASGVGARTIQEYENGKPFRRPPQKLWDLLRYYRWTPDSLRRVLDGGLPTYLPDPVPALGPRAYAEVVQAIQESKDLTARRKRILLKDFAEREHLPETI